MHITQVRYVYLDQKVHNPHRDNESQKYRRAESNYAHDADHLKQSRGGHGQSHRYNHINHVNIFTKSVQYTSEWSDVKEMSRWPHNVEK